MYLVIVQNVHNKLCKILLFLTLNSFKGKLQIQSSNLEQRMVCNFLF